MIHSGRQITFGLLLMVLNCATAQARPVAALNLAALVEGADQIAVGQVLAVSQRAHTTIELEGNPVPVIRMAATLRVDRVLKGEDHQPSLYFEFMAGEFGAFEAIVPGQFGMFFFKKAA